MRPMRYVVLGAALGLLAQPAYAFQETTVGGGNQKPAEVAPSDNPPKTTIEPGKGLNLTIPEIGVGKSSGTEVRIPGIGTVGILPKLDFGLELLYGATEERSAPEKLLPEKAEPNDLQIRGTLKHRF